MVDAPMLDTLRANLAAREAHITNLVAQARPVSDRMLSMYRLGSVIA